MTREPVERAAAKLRSVYLRSLGGAFGAFYLSFLAAALLGLGLVARVGTERARMGATAIGVVAVLVTLGIAVVRKRRMRVPSDVVTHIVRKADPELGAAIARAIVLSDRSDRETKSGATADTSVTAALSELHLTRKLDLVPVAKVEARASRQGAQVAAAALGLAAIAVAWTLTDPLKIVEGHFVLVAQRGVAPLGISYLDEVDILAVRPAYLDMEDEELEDFGDHAEPRGTTIAVRGKPLHDGRVLVLTDGNKEQPFVDDGTGLLIARWTLGETAPLRIAARFGDIRIEQKDSLAIESIPDLAPVVHLEGAPKTVRLVDTPSVPLRFEATDDHGLREIALVFRAGRNEERKVLSRLTNDKREASGAHELSTREPFFKKSYLPVEVTVEARDNDAVLGPKWGRSEALVVVPPLIGEAEARRFVALKSARDALVDLAALRVEQSVDKELKVDASFAKSADEAQSKASKVVEEVLAGTYGGLTVRGRSRRIIGGQMRLLDKALFDFKKAPSATSFAAFVKVTENVVLAVDAAIRGVGNADAAKVAKRLSTVAEEIAIVGRAMAPPSDRESNAGRYDANLDVLRRAGVELAKLAELGADLGDVVRGGAGRIDRSRTAENFLHVELAAKDLAERLRHAESSVGGGGRPGVESGAPSGGGEGAEEGEASDAEGEAEKSGKELDELIKDHAQKIAEVADMMKNATTDEERDALKKLAREQAEMIREAVKGLPQQGLAGEPSEKAAEGRRHAESMAGSLEQGEIDRALEQGKDALDALREATRRGTTSPYNSEQDTAQEAQKGGNRLEEALDALKSAKQKTDEASKQRAREGLKGAGSDEGRLAERTADLKRRGEQGDSSMPDESLQKLKEAEEAMRDAEKSLEQGDNERGQGQQKEAQRLLEMAKGEEENDNNSDDGDRNGDDKKMAQDTDVPDKNHHKGPEEFRKRVTDGLGKSPDPRLRDALKRYTEGLLK